MCMHSPRAWGCLLTALHVAVPLWSNPQDNYSVDVLDDPLLPGGFHEFINGHECYNPSKDLVIPLWRSAGFFRRSIYLGAQPRKRDWLVFHRGR